MSDTGLASRSPSLFSRFRSRVDRGFGRFAIIVAAHPWLVIATTSIAFFVVASQAPHVRLSTNTEEFLLPDHPVRVAYGEFRDRFGSDNMVLVTLRSEDLFAEDFLSWLRLLHEDLETRVPYVNEITSLINVRSTRGEGDTLLVDELLADWPRDQAAFGRVGELVRNTPFHQRIVIGDDGIRTTIQIELESHVVTGIAQADFDGFDDVTGDDERADSRPHSSRDGSERIPLGGIHEAEVMTEVYAVLAEHARPDVEIVVAGTPYINVRIFEDVGKNVPMFIVSSVLIVGVVLFLVFRRASGVVLPLLVVLMSLMATMGFIGLRGSPVGMTVQILPSFLLAVECSSSIHLLWLFFRSFDAGESRVDSLEHALAHAGMPIFLACGTTAAGMASFLVTDVAPVRDIGFAAPVGVLTGFTLCVTLLPALLMVVPIRRKDPARAAGPTALSRAVVRLGEFSVSRPVPVLVVTALIVAISLAGFSRVRFEHDALSWFPASDPIHTNTRISDSFMGGTASIEILVDTGRENGLHEPDFQRRLEAFEDSLTNESSDRDSIRKVTSVSNVLREIHQALNQNDPAFYATPDDRTLIAQELLLFENSGSDDLEKLVDSSFRVARISARTVHGDGGFYTGLLSRTRSAAREAFPEADVQVTGMVPIIMTSMVESEIGMRESYALAFLTITPLMMLLVGSLRGGLSSMVPNLAPVAIVVGLMGWLDIPFDMFTVMTGSIAIGLAVDDTIHFMHVFYREFDRTGDTLSSVRRTLETTGQALLTTSIVLATGFAVFLVSTMPTLRIFGMITTLAIVLAFMADIVVAPALVTLATRRRRMSAHSRAS